MAAPSVILKNSDLSSEYAAAVTPSDTTEFSPVPRAFYIGTGGNVVFTMMGDGADVTFSNIVGGSILSVRAKKVKAATSASDIVALY